MRKPKVENKYKLRPKDIEKAIVLDYDRLHQPPFWRNDVVQAWCLTGGSGKGLYGGWIDSYWIGFYDSNAKEHANKIRLSCTSYEEMCNYNFTGFFIGPMAEFNIPVVGLGVDASLLFAQRGIKISDGGEEATVKQNGLDIPVNLKYNIGLGSLVGLYVAAGPDFYFDFAGNKTIDGVRTDKKKAEVGINVGAGVKLLNHLQVGANYNIPLGKTASFEDIEGSYKTKTWQVSVAYIF